MTVISHVDGKTETVYRLFDEMAKKHDELVMHFSYPYALPIASDISRSKIFSVTHSPTLKF